MWFESTRLTKMLLPLQAGSGPAARAASKEFTSCMVKCSRGGSLLMAQMKLVPRSLSKRAASIAGPNKWGWFLEHRAHIARYGPFVFIAAAYTHNCVHDRLNTAPLIIYNKKAEVLPQLIPYLTGNRIQIHHPLYEWSDPQV